MSAEPDPAVKAEAESLKAEIADLESKLYAKYTARRELFIRLDKSHGGPLSRREIGDLWGISNVAVTYVINGNKFKVPKDSA
jgi:hypothetical protein